MTENMVDLISNGALLKFEIDRMSAELRSINKKIEQAAVFKPGSKTGYVVGGGYRVKVVNRDNVKWDQERLAQVRNLLPEDFAKTFEYEFKPKTAKELEKQMIANPEFSKAVNWAREVKPGQSTVTYELIDEVADVT